MPMPASLTTGTGPRIDQRHRAFDLLLFARELRALLRAGLNVFEAVEALAEQAMGSTQHAVFATMLDRLREGHTLSRSLEFQPDIFPALFVAGIRANETSGGLLEALGRYIVYAEQLAELRKKIRSAALYPAILLAVGLAVMAFLMLFLVPRFSTIYEGGSASLPLLSRLLMRWGALMHAYPGPVLLSLLAAVAVLVVVFSRPATRALAWRELKRLTAVRNIVQHFFLARLYRTLGMLLNAGIPAVSALGMARSLLPPDMATQLDTAMAEVRQGRSLSSALETHGLTTPIAARLLRVGERSGELAAMMDHIAEFLDDSLARWVDTISRVAEPLLMLFIGGFIGLIVILMYLPIFELASGIGT